MNSYFFKMNKQERDNILDQHKHVYDGYVTKYNQESNQTPLYVQDLANDKNGLTLNNKGEVKPYTNMGINESHTGLDMIGGDTHDQSEMKYRHLKNGTVDVDSVDDTMDSNNEMMHDVYPSPNEDESEYITYGKFGDEMAQNLDQYEYDIDELDDYSTDPLYEMYHEEEPESYGEEEEIVGEIPKFDWLRTKENDMDGFYEVGDDDDEENLSNLVSNITESLDMFERFKKYN